MSFCCLFPRSSPPRCITQQPSGAKQCGALRPISSPSQDRRISPPPSQPSQAHLSLPCLPGTRSTISSVSVTPGSFLFPAKLSRAEKYPLGRGLAGREESGSQTHRHHTDRQEEPTAQPLWKRARLQSPGGSWAPPPGPCAPGCVSPLCSECGY